jgi:hypothetical protein
MFDRSLGEYRGAALEYLEFEEPKPSATYAHGADWAKDQDWTVIITIRCDVTPYRIVCFERTGRLPWPIMVKKLDDRIDLYSGDHWESSAMHDGTGIGNVVDDYLRHDVLAFIMTGRPRRDLLTEYVNAIENDEIKSPFIEFMYGEHVFCTTDHLYGNKHLPDSIAAGALAYRAITEEAAGIQVETGENPLSGYRG